MEDWQHGCSETLLVEELETTMNPLVWWLFSCFGGLGLTNSLLLLLLYNSGMVSKVLLIAPETVAEFMLFGSEVWVSHYSNRGLLCAD